MRKKIKIILFFLLLITGTLSTNKLSADDPVVTVGLLCCNALPGECWWLDETEEDGYFEMPGQFIEP